MYEMPPTIERSVGLAVVARNRRLMLNLENPNLFESALTASTTSHRSTEIATVRHTNPLISRCARTENQAAKLTNVAESQI